ncbi:carboxymuconolactone decarboxylase family protein [Micromonospora echinofusca]|uniref:carboxymuconolactone decarboxylase family protein n=1 Tax=Micromonospora echinofusca TaxID=47858 RepID=UPI000C70FF77|nr:carboxymuconolactone decarboxylase family protein [Micromonospora sp. MSM11]MCL7456270.1 carboxymuconolactone decarboxylase family protein [Micromonospora sp. MSM11]
MTAPRIGPGGRQDVGTFGWLFSQAAGRVTGTGPPNLFLTLGRHRPLFRGWLRFARRLMPGGVLPRRETELVILRVAHLCACRYEHDHHLRLARRAGVTDAEIERVSGDDIGVGWSAREHAVLVAVDGLVRHRDLDDEAWTALRAHLDERECIELCMLVGHYVMLATTITTLRIQPDRPPG